MEDRNAFTDNRKGQGVPDNQARTPKVYGVPKDGFGGLVPAQARMRGSTMDEMGYLVKNYPQPETGGRKCKGKDGTCKAHPMKDGDYCYGHSRGQGRNTS
jgi:hypothetical protein